MDLTFSVLALLPLALLGWRRGYRASDAGFLPLLLAALAPVIAKGIGSVIGSKQKKSAQQQAEEQRRLETQQADAQAKRSFEEQQNSPAAQQARFRNTLQLGRLAGGLGGMDKVPPSIAKYYQSMRTAPQYTGTSSYIPTPKKGGGVWDFLGGVTDALSYLDTSKLKGGQPPMGQTPQILSSNGIMPGSAAPNPSTDAIVGLTQRLRNPMTPTYPPKG